MKNGVSRKHSQTERDRQTETDRQKQRQNRDDDEEHCSREGNNSGVVWMAGMGVVEVQVSSLR